MLYQDLASGAEIQTHDFSILSILHDQWTTATTLCIPRNEFTNLFVCSEENEILTQVMFHLQVV